MPRTTAPTEHSEQVTFVQYVKLQYQHDPSFMEPLFFAVPNGMFAGGHSHGARMMIMAKMKAEGFNPGVADILYLQPRGMFPYLAIEMKRSNMRNWKDEGKSDTQVGFTEAAVLVGAYYKVCFGFEDAKDAFDFYMRFPPNG